MVDNTLFTKKSKLHLIIVQIYVDDIIFGSTSQNLCDDFAKIMHDEFEMSMMGELNFFLGLQMKQIEDGIFFYQSKYVNEMLKKFGLEDSKLTKTPLSTMIKLTKDDEADFIDSSKYRGPLNGLLYRRCTCEWCGNNLRDGFCSFCNARARNSFIYDSNPTSFDYPPNFSYQPSQPQYESNSCELCGNDSHYGYDCPPQFPLVYEQEPRLILVLILPSLRDGSIFFFDDDDDYDYEESTIPLNEIISQIPPSIAITPILPTMDPEDTLIMGDEDLSTIPKKELDEVINSSVEDVVLS
nr:copia protein [Tanacetum cinerariifolium]